MDPEELFINLYHVRGLKTDVDLIWHVDRMHAISRKMTPTVEQSYLRANGWR